MRLQPHLVQMTVGGVKIDKALKDRLADVIGAEIAAMRVQFEDLVSDVLHDPDYRHNPNSTPQMKELIFNKLQMKS